MLVTARDPSDVTAHEGHDSAAALSAALGRQLESISDQLDTILIEAQRRRERSSALLELAHALATAGELADRLAAAVPPQHDELTGLASRSQLSELVRAAITRAHYRPELVTLFYIEVEGLGEVNDVLGHDVGDQLEIAVGERLSGRMRAGDTVARLGGDAYAVLIDAHTTPQGSDALAARLVEAFAGPFTAGGLDIKLAASVVRASFPRDADSADGLLRFADRAIREAKRRRTDRALTNP